MTVAISTFINEVAGDVPGAPYPTIERQFQRTLVDFCQRTWVWQTTLGPLTAIKDRGLYTVVPDQSLSAKVLSVLAMRHRDLDLSAKTEAQLDREEPGWRDRQNKRASFFIPRQFGEFRLVPKPAETVARSITDIVVALYPERTITEVPDSLADPWYEALAAGARARLMKMPGREWSDLKMAAVAENEYAEGVADAKYRAIQSWGTTTHSVPKRPLPGMP